MKISIYKFQLTCYLGNTDKTSKLLFIHGSIRQIGPRYKKGMINTVFSMISIHQDMDRFESERKLT